MRSVASGSAQQVAISSSCHDIVASISAVGHLFTVAGSTAWNSLPACSVIRHLAKTLLGDY